MSLQGRSLGVRERGRSTYQVLRLKERQKRTVEEFERKNALRLDDVAHARRMDRLNREHQSAIMRVALFDTRDQLESLQRTQRCKPRHNLPCVGENGNVGHSAREFLTAHQEDRSTTTV